MKENPDKWFIISSDGRWILQTVGTVAPAHMSGLLDVYFESEVEAHIAAAVFYSYFNEDYPYITEWADSVVDNMSKNPIDIEQETMEFI